MKILVYGTLKKGFGNNRLLEKSRLVASGVFEIPNHRLIESGLPYLIRSVETTPFYGEIYEVDEATLERLDSLEGHPDWYKRTYIESLGVSVYVLQTVEPGLLAQDAIYNYGA